MSQDSTTARPQGEALTSLGFDLLTAPPGSTRPEGFSTLPSR